MNALDFATHTELATLSSRITRQAIKRYLTANAIPFLTDADGNPRVLRAVLATRLGGQVAPPPPPEPKLRLRNG